MQGVDQRGFIRDTLCDIGAFEEGASPASNDALVLFDPATADTSLHSSVLDNPATVDFSNTPPTNTAPEWVMGDWDGDGEKTPGIFDSGAFRYTNDIGPSANWSGGIWLGNAGSRVAVVSGRYTNAFSNDCIGWVDSNTSPVTGDLRFSLKYWCDMTASGAVSLSSQWLGSPLGDSGGFAGTHQFAYGDWDNDGVDEPGIRRSDRIVRSDTAPNEGAATYPPGSAQRWDTGDGDGPGAHGLNEGLFVAGDWNGDGVDTWGVVYDDNTFYYRDVFGFNPGPFEFSSQTFTSSIATPRQVDSHHNAAGGSSAPGPAAPVIVANNPTDTPEPTDVPPTEVPPTDTLEPTDVPPTDTPEPTNTPISIGVPSTATDVPPTDTPEPTATEEPTLTPTPIVIEPTVTPVPTETEVPDPVRLPVVEPMDDGAPHWLAQGGWELTENASYTPDGLGWQTFSTNDASTLQFYAPIILSNVPYPNLRFQSNLQASHSSAQVEISLDAQTWLVVDVIEPSEGWVAQSIDLSDYRSLTIYLRFNWVSSETTVSQGEDYWMVDEVDLRNHPFDDPTATPNPVITNPTDIPSGGGSTIGSGGQPTAEPPEPTPVPGVTQIGIGGN